jgi:hypothetical protein
VSYFIDRANEYRPHDPAKLRREIIRLRGCGWKARDISLALQIAEPIVLEAINAPPPRSQTLHRDDVVRLRTRGWSIKRIGDQLDLPTDTVIEILNAAKTSTTPRQPS